ncbi:MAG: 2-C-methyl-D-erythritol 4-phosphate cytidylyltransferase, partial [Planctomycetales bacterium]|nr:2-C-methyl-D-erythritol 4-phosphate cytidylyltransferase [Planctomycetales bacterium]
MERVVSVLVPAAGRGVRLGARVPKAFVDLGGKPILAWTLSAFAGISEVVERIVVVPPGSVGHLPPRVARALAGFEGVRVVAGGERRQDSVRAGLEALRAEATVVVVHDAARPFASPRLIRDVIAAAARSGAALAAVPVADTVKRVAGESEGRLRVA